MKTTYFRIAYYSTTATAEAAYIIGGWPYSYQSIAEFKVFRWRVLGYMVKGRRGHGSITVEGQTMIIGGISETGR